MQNKVSYIRCTPVPARTALCAAYKICWIEATNPCDQSHYPSLPSHPSKMWIGKLGISPIISHNDKTQHLDTQQDCWDLGLRSGMCVIVADWVIASEYSAAFMLVQNDVCSTICWFWEERGRQYIHFHKLSREAVQYVSSIALESCDKWETAVTEKELLLECLTPSG